MSVPSSGPNFGWQPPEEKVKFTREDAKKMVVFPAAFLMILSSLTIVYCFLSPVYLLAVVATAAPGDTVILAGYMLTVYIVYCVITIIFQVLILQGAAMLKGLRGFPMSLIACILACIPCVTPFGVLGIAFGAWGLVAMMNPKVRRLFK